MEVKEIIKDAIKYPLSDWKKILILGIIFILTNIVGIKSITAILSTHIVVIYFLIIIGYIIGFFIYGYLLRIVKCSIVNTVELPEFNAWVNMFIDGVKVFIIGIIYAIPAILTILIFVSLSMSTLEIIGSNPSTFAVDIISKSGILGFIAILYMILIGPILSIAIVNMANNGSELGAAFRFHEILNKISSIGWGKLTIWYIMTGILFLILATIGIFIIALFDVLINPIVGQVLTPLILIPYLYMYSARAVALIYKPE